MLNVRLRFSKLFSARYISHLDLARCFARAVKQSGADVWYTEGFNPHLYITFALPLSLGFESICEAADIRLAGDDFDNYMANKINRGLPYGLEVYDAGPPAQRVADIAWCHYKIELAGSLPPGRVAEAAMALAARDSIETQKLTKKGAATIDIRPMIHSLGAETQNGVCHIDAVTAAGSGQSLNPQLLLDVLFRELGQQPEHQLIKRIRILNTAFGTFE